MKPEVEIAVERMSVKIMITLRFVNPDALGDFAPADEFRDDGASNVLNNQGVTIK